MQYSKVDFPCHVFTSTRRTPTKEIRRVVADHAVTWITYKHGMGESGCVIFDIDDTLVNGQERPSNGFEFMVSMYKKVSMLYPIHIVTARPRSTQSRTLAMLSSHGICIPVDRLHMIADHLWGTTDAATERFKWEAYLACRKLHNGVIARYGDMLWDVAHVDSLHTYMKELSGCHACIFFDPKMPGTLSGKLPSKRED